MKPGKTWAVSGAVSWALSGAVSWIGLAAAVFVAFGIIWPRTANAQRPGCGAVPCSGAVTQAPGAGWAASQGNAPAWSGVLIQNGTNQPTPRTRPDALRNDDIEDGGDVLAGPRRHRRTAPPPPSRDDAD